MKFTRLNFKNKFLKFSCALVITAGGILLSIKGISAFPYYPLLGTPPINIIGGTQFYTQVGTAWSTTFTATGGTGVFTYTLPTAPGGASVDAFGVVSYTPAAAGSYSFILRATDTSTNYKEVSFTLDVYAVGVCLWTGTTSTAWTNASNWTYCGGSAPISTSDIAIYSAAPNMPTLAANTTVNSFGLGPGGGTITVNAGIILTMSATTNTIRSSVQFQGATNTCANCTVTGSGNIYVTDAATLTLLKGIKFIPASNNGLFFGNGTTSGNLTTNAGTTSTEWPVISNCLAPASYISFNGTASKKSIAKINGLSAGITCGSNANIINFADYYDIQQFDNITFNNLGTANQVGFAAVKFSICTNASVSSATWLNHTYTTTPTSGAYNVNASGTNCSTLPVITVNPAASNYGGPGYGTPFENDPNNKINWVNDTSFNCTWTGAADSSWTNPSNWSGCTNGRLNYPDQLDRVIIPATATQPVISSNITVFGFGLSGSGGGTVTVNSGFTLTLVANTSTIRSNVKFQGSTTTCTNCKVEGKGSIVITDGATVTLLKGIRFTALDSTTSYIDVGDGVTAGILATGPAGPVTEWPTIGGATYVRFRVTGSASQRSALNLDGAVISHGNFSGATALLTLADWYEIQKFDNIKIGLNGNGFGSPSNFSAIQMTNCTNALMTDTTWSEMNFTSYPNSGSYNINASGTNCSTLTPITIVNASGTSGGLGYGSFYENDPNNKITWSNDTSFNCTWTGTTSSAWTTPTNWSGCTNGRGNYPDQIDTAVIPVTATQPTVSSIISLRGIGVGAGGGTVTVNAANLVLMAPTSTLRSDVKFQGATTTCTNCKVLSADNFYVTDGATLTLLKGIKLNPYSSKGLFFGDGTTSGNLTTIAGTTSTEWPVISDCVVSPTSYIKFNGTAAQKSILKANGLYAGITCGNVSSIINFADYYDVQQFDNVTFNNSGIVAGASSAAIKFTNCTNALITNNVWINHNFTNTPGAGTYNVNASGTNCSTLTKTYMYQSTGSGTGSTYENDPNNKIFWTNVMITGATNYMASVGTAWSQTFSASGGTLPYTYSLPTAPGGATINSSTGQVDFTPGSTGIQNFTIRVTEAGGTSFDFDFTLDVYAAGVCVWNGSVSTAWTNSSNWSFCSGAAPISTSDIAIFPGATNMPILAAGATINSFGLGTGGGTITVNAGMTLTVNAATNTFRSSVMFQGATASCTTCYVGFSNDAYITDNSTLTLKSGINFSNSWGKKLYVGNGTTGGTLATGTADANSNNWPRFGWPNGFIIANGASGESCDF